MQHYLLQNTVYLLAYSVRPKYPAAPVPTIRLFPPRKIKITRELFPRFVLINYGVPAPSKLSLEGKLACPKITSWEFVRGAFVSLLFSFLSLVAPITRPSRPRPR